jgi:hypothetical protein
VRYPSAFVHFACFPVSNTLPQGKVLRYRVLLHHGDEKQAGIAAAFAKYAGSK